MFYIMFLFSQVTSQVSPALKQNLETLWQPKISQIEKVQENQANDIQRLDDQVQQLEVEKCMK